MMSAPSGVRLAGFITNGQPAAIAGAILCAARLSGKLNGEMNEHGPIGTRFHIAVIALGARRNLQLTDLAVDPHAFLGGDPEGVDQARDLAFASP